MTMKAALWPLEEHVEKLEWEMQWLREDQEKLQTAFEGECIVMMLRNKSVMAQMTLVGKQLEETRETLNDFKIPEDIPDHVATFCNVVRQS
ncbi:hypothetical protein CJ030_MR6G028226 [Morella rubra]|uniref:Uncharacterized protein n=1 Tax=Morella rubra TaxID=262757 RepID=A0A6A1VAF9_9ROSI|nr:hypothetical protein CJ030_MR6G028226 [Morella rubra]